MSERQTPRCTCCPCACAHGTPPPRAPSALHSRRMVRFQLHNAEGTKLLTSVCRGTEYWVTVLIDTQPDYINNVLITADAANVLAQNIPAW